jgi:DNA-binding NtrC family response regulator
VLGQQVNRFGEKGNNKVNAQILVVDDEPDFCSNMADILGDMGYGVDVAYRAVDAIQRAETRPYDLFLLDYRLPCMTGAELYKRLRASRASTPALMVTAFASHDAVAEAAAAGVSEVIQKPVDFRKLISTIERQLPDRSNQQDAAPGRP